MQVSSHGKGYFTEQISLPPRVRPCSTFFSTGNVQCKIAFIFKSSYFWGPPGLDFRPIVFLIFINNLPNSNFMKTILFANDRVLVQGDNNLGKLQNSVYRVMTKVMVGCLQTNSH